ncbi:MAG TPA: LysE family translocator [Flavobacteriia bacterium]|nr:LysE family translocator [Flavobacteriia bacterium]
MSDIINALISGFFLSFMVGPVFFVLLETSATKGIKQAVIFDLGVIFADIIFILLSYYGSYTLLNKIKDDPRLFFAGGILLFSYGLITFVKEKRRKIILDPKLVIVEKVNFFGMFLKGFLLNFINVGVLGFWLALVIVISSNVGMNGERVFMYFTTIIIAYFVTDLGKIILAKQLKSKLTPHVITKIRKIMGIILMVIGLAVASKGFIPQKTIDKFTNKAEEVMH